MNYRIRTNQQQILTYADSARSGRMGIAAVPGSGKTWTLSLLAARIIASGRLKDDQEVLVVTLVNSAVDNFYERVSDFVSQANLLPNLGYRVRTLHGLAHDIVRERPDLAGMDSNFQILDDNESAAIKADVARIWLKNHPGALDNYLDVDLSEEQYAWIQRDHLPDLVASASSYFIRAAKDKQGSPEHLNALLSELPSHILPLAEMGCAIYDEYQRALQYRGAVDFDDLIRLALQVLHSDDTLLQRLRYRWPYILEDEAQDSSALQEKILETLVGPAGNWVRVGDPNQAIYETFTTASPKYLRSFLVQPNVNRQELPVSGRSTTSIIHLANTLVDWTMKEHQRPEVRDALQAPPYIFPAPEGDPQPNPTDDPSGVVLYLKKMSPGEEIKSVADSLERWLPDHPNHTVAVLTAINNHAFSLVDELNRRRIPCNDNLLRSSSKTRFSAKILGGILRYLADPQSSRKLAEVFKIWKQDKGQDPEKQRFIQQTAEIIQKCRRIETFLWPTPQEDWLYQLSLQQDNPATAPASLMLDTLIEFRETIQRWQKSILLPVDQLVLSLAQDLLKEPAELAIAHKLALLLRQASLTHPIWQLNELAEELAVISRNERRFIGFSEDETGFNPDKHKGEVVVATIHKAKGLEWDRVYVMSVNNYDFPSGESYDSFIAEKWYLRGHLNLEAEAMKQLLSLVEPDPYTWYEEGIASQQARLDYIRERLRLFYVGITRARRELIITWNTGKRSKKTALAAIPLVALADHWTSYQQERSDRRPSESL